MDKDKEDKGILDTIKDTAKKAVEKTKDVANNATTKTKGGLETALYKVMDVKDDMKKGANMMSQNFKLLMQILCSPAIVYLAISITVLSSLFMEGMQSHIFGLSLLKVLIWTYCINYLCRNGFMTIAWAIVMVPYALIPLQILGITKLPRKYYGAFISTEEQIFFGI